MLRRLGPEARDPLEELLQRALKPSAHAAATLQRFLYDIEIDSGQVKRELEAETGAVRVMTVHGAKGLEAPRGDFARRDRRQSATSPTTA